MEGLSKRLGILCAVILTSGIVNHFGPSIPQKERTEEEVAAMLPLKVNNFTAQLANGQYCSYRLDQSNYDVLHPWGIVARAFSNGPEKYEVVAIASRRKESFHDPQTCLTAQGWTLTNQRVSSVETKSRGTVPITLFEMEKGSEKHTALYFLKLTEGYFAEFSTVKTQMLKHKIVHLLKDDEGAFIRIIPEGPSDEDKIKQFASDWIDEAVSTSKGYY